MELRAIVCFPPQNYVLLYWNNRLLNKKKKKNYS